MRLRVPVAEQPNFYIQIEQNALSGSPVGQILILFILPYVTVKSHQTLLSVHLPPVQTHRTRVSDKKDKNQNECRNQTKAKNHPLRWEKPFERQQNHKIHIWRFLFYWFEWRSYGIVDNFQARENCILLQENDKHKDVNGVDQ